MGLAIGPEPGEARIGKPDFAALTTLERDRPGGFEAPELSLREVGDRHGTGPGTGRREASGEEVRIELHALDESGPDVGGDRADAHPGKRLAQARIECIEEALAGRRWGHVLRPTRPGELRCALEREPRVDDRRPGREDHRQRVDVEDVAGRRDDVEPATQAGVGERGVYGTDGEDRRDRQSEEGECPV